MIGLNVYLGYRSGLIRRAIALVAVFGAAVSAYNVGNPIAGAVGGGTLYANAWSFTGVFVLVIVMLEILGALYADRLERIPPDGAPGIANWDAWGRFRAHVHRAVHEALTG